MATKPTQITTWALDDITDPGSGQANKIIPSTSKQDDGWVFLEKPPFNWFNYWMNSVHLWKEYFEATTDDILFNTLTISGEKTFSNNLRINAGLGIHKIANPDWALDIQNWQSLILGADNDTSNARTDGTQKGGRIGGAHYANAELPISFGYLDATLEDNTINIGGGTSRMNAATEIKFYTAADTITPGGTERIVITNTAVIIGERTGSPSYSATLAVNGNFAVHLDGTDNKRVINSSFSGSTTTGAGTLSLYDNVSGEIETIKLMANGESFLNGGGLNISGTLTTGEIGNNTTFKDDAPTNSDIFYSLANAVPASGDVAMLSGAAKYVSDGYTLIFAFCERLSATNIEIVLINLTGSLTEYVSVVKDDPATTFELVVFSAIKIR